MSNFYNNRTKTLTVDNIVTSAIRLGTNVLDSDWVISLINKFQSPLDSDYVKEWVLESVERLVDSEFVLSVIADSDSLVAMIKGLESRLDSEEADINAQNLANLLKFVLLDSDVDAVNARITALKLEDLSDTQVLFPSDRRYLQWDVGVNAWVANPITNNSDWSDLQIRLNLIDSDIDEVKADIEDTKAIVQANLDSDINILKSRVTLAEGRLDSDSAAIQANLSTLNAEVARLDSDINAHDTRITLLENAGAFTWSGEKDQGTTHTGMSGAREIVILISDLISIDTINLFGVQIGDSGGIETTGYNSYRFEFGQASPNAVINSSLWSIGGSIDNPHTAAAMILLHSPNGTFWTMKCHYASKTNVSNYDWQQVTIGSKTLTAELDRVSVLNLFPMPHQSGNWRVGWR